MAWLIGPGWILAGIVIYFLYARSRASPIREEILLMEKSTAPAALGTHMLFPVIDVDTTLSLIPQIVAIAESRKVPVELLHLVSFGGLPLVVEPRRDRRLQPPRSLGSDGARARRTLIQRDGESLPGSRIARPAGARSARRMPGPESPD